MKDLESLVEETHAEIVASLREKRKALGLTQAELGELTGMDSTLICHMERGRFSNIKILLKVLAALELKIKFEPIA